MSTDPTSQTFDPLSALYTEDDEPPPDGVKIYDNIAMFEGNLRKQEFGLVNQPGTSKKSEKSFSKKKRLQDEARNRDLGKLIELMEARRKLDQGIAGTSQEKSQKVSARQPRKKKTILTSMEMLSKGPFNIVYKIAKSHARCNVYTRDFCGLRGVCCGYIIAYDRYLNLAMVDVDETFRKPPLGEVAAHQKPLSVSKLEQAVKSLTIGKAQMKDPRSKHRTERKAHSEPTDEHSETSTRTSTDKQKVKTVGVKFFENEVFHGGGPQLYHRHVDQLLVRGDSIVIVSPKK